MLAVRSRGDGGGGGMVTGEPGKLWYVSSQKVLAVVSRAGRTHSWIFRVQVPGTGIYTGNSLLQRLTARTLFPHPPRAHSPTPVPEYPRVPTD